MKKKPNTQRRWRYAAILSVALASAGVTAAVSKGLPVNGPAEGWTIRMIYSVSGVMLAQMGAFGSGLAKMIAFRFEQIISAIAVATKQEAVSANVVAEAGKNASQTLVTAVKADKESEDVMKAVLDISPATGQGHDLCGSKAKATTINNAFDQLGAHAQKTLQALDVAPGKLDGDGNALLRRLKTHRENFCTQAEADVGLCSLSDLPGADTNAAVLFESSAPGSLKHKAQLAYIQNVLGEPNESLPAKAGKSAQGQNYMIAANGKDALLSIPAYSLASIHAANTQIPDMGGVSANEAIRERVNDNFGGKNAKQWSHTLAVQTERGLMVEAVKLSGLEVWLRHQQYKQNQRLELNLAALGLIAARNTKFEVDEKYERMVRDNSTQDIK